MNIAGYKIEKQIGKGGMAIVYLAIQESLDRPVALKVMNPLYSDSAQFSERFLDEGRLLASVHHTNIITIHDIGISNDFHFISMEYVEGGDLRKRLREGITPEMATDYIESVAGCLSVAHDVFIVHRDIKPANILFRKDDTLLLSDFGIAKQLTGNKGLTVTGSMVGSLYYLSPEQAQGKLVDGRADIYSLGVLYYEMLTGKRPFSGDSAIAIAVKHVTEPLPELPVALVAYSGILERMTRKNPDDRFPSCKSLLRALRELKTTGQWSGEVVPIPLPEVQEAPPSSEIRATAESPVVDASSVGQPSAKADETVVLEETVAGADAVSSISAGANQDAATIETTAVTQPIGPASEPRQKNPWWIGGGVVAFVVIVVAAGSFLASSPDTSTGKDQPVAKEVATPSFAEEERQRLARQAKAEEERRRLARQAKIDGLLQQAEPALEQYQLTTPKETSAYTYYQEVLSLDSNNTSARQGIDDIASRYYLLARTAESDWDYDLAKRYVATGLGVRPEHEQLLQLQEELKKQEGKAEHKLKKGLKGVKKWFKEK